LFLKVDISESDTRSKILDKIIIDVLGWSETDINREGYVKNAGYYDYLIILPTFQFVVEAKKNFENFNLALQTRNIKIKTLMKGNKAIIDQIRSYIAAKNLSIGIATNGHQFIIGQFVNVEGVDWQENDCKIYHSLEDIEKNFVQFYNDLSREAVREYGRIKIFSTPPTGKTILDSIIQRDERLVRNIFSIPLQPIIKKFFSELFTDEEKDIDYDFLEKCYVKNEDIKKYNKELNIIIHDNPPTFDERINKVQNTNNTMVQLKSEINEGIKYLPDPILIIGGKGVGKTTFIKYFIRVILDPEKVKERLIVYLDFKNYTEQQINDTEKIYKQILDKINEKYHDLNLNKLNIIEKIYKKELNQQEEGIWTLIKDDTTELNRRKSAYLEELISDSILHLNKISKYLIGICRKRLTIIFDNVDQLPDKCQRSVYLLAQSIHNTTKSVIILSLREGYFYKLKSSPPFDAFRSTIYHITAPPYSEVLKRRFNFILTNFSFPKISIPGETVQYESQTLKTLFMNFNYTLFEKENSDVLKYLEQSSYPNIRIGLDKMVEFMISANTQISQYIYSAKYSIPIWEFVKSVALGSRKYYDHVDSKVYNLFYPATNNSNHFTKIRLLLFLMHNLAHERKFISLESIINAFGLAGYSSDIVKAEIRELSKYGLIEGDLYISDISFNEDIPQRDNLRLTNSGYYYLDNLGRFYYLELALQDTPIFDPQIYTNILKNFPFVDDEGFRDLKKRIKVVNSFFLYLHHQEKYERSRYFSSKLDHIFSIDITNELIRPLLREEMFRVNKALKYRTSYY
ncbi:MAG: hypothetical protein Q8N83_12985, partial [Ignavibacteria bacterium]|nr:hypothetical protein [Ignavibacteria bacterium]